MYRGYVLMLRMIFAALLLVSSPLFAQDLVPQKNDSIPVETKITETSANEPKEEFSETYHQVVINGQTVLYKAIAGNLLIKDEKGHPKASLFFISYSKEGIEKPSERPVTFCFNGGPGSSSVW